MQIKLTSIYVNDQDRALAFYTEKLGFEKAAENVNGDYRWLTVRPAEQPEGPELQLALNNDAAAEAYQRALYSQQRPALMLHTAGLENECQRLTNLGVTFPVPFTKEAWGSMAVLDDTCGNLIQLTQPAW